MADLSLDICCCSCFLSWRSARSGPADGISGDEHFLLSGRRLTLPAFVATLVSTWYGGILGVGEFSYLYGISQWVVMGLPYYVFAVLFAVFFAGKIRENPAISIPESVGAVYGTRASKLSAGLIFMLVNPAPYLLMTAVLASFMLGVDGWYIVVGCSGFFRFVCVLGGIWRCGANRYAAGCAHVRRVHRTAHFRLAICGQPGRNMGSAA